MLFFSLLDSTREREQLENIVPPLEEGVLAQGRRIETFQYCNIGKHHIFKN